MQIIRELGFPFSTGNNVEKNQVETCATDRALFETSLRNANLSLPEHVEIV